MRLYLIALLAVLAAPFAHADEIEQTIEAALDAYRAGDVQLAKEELDFASQLMAQQKAEGLSAFLPAPLGGWERDVADTTQSIAAFGGGLMAEAEYTDGSDVVSIQMMADNQMVVGVAAMMNNPALMGAIGKVKRINRQKIVVTPDGDLQALIDRRILVRVSGSAPLDVKEAYFGALDIPGLSEF